MFFNKMPYLPKRRKKMSLNLMRMQIGMKASTDKTKSYALFDTDST